LISQSHRCYESAVSLSSPALRVLMSFCYLIPRSFSVLNWCRNCDLQPTSSLDATLGSRCLRNLQPACSPFREYRLSGQPLSTMTSSIGSWGLGGGGGAAVCSLPDRLRPTWKPLCLVFLVATLSAPKVTGAISCGSRFPLYR